MTAALPDRLCLRPLTAADHTDVARIYVDAVQRGTIGIYSQAERDAWSGTGPSPEAWRRKIAPMTGVVAEIDRLPVGFMTIDEDGYIDLAFVAPDVARCGVGGQLYLAILDLARTFGATRWTTQRVRPCCRCSSCCSSRPSSSAPRV